MKNYGPLIATGGTRTIYHHKVESHAQINIYEYVRVKAICKFTLRHKCHLCVARPFKQWLYVNVTRILCAYHTGSYTFALRNLDKGLVTLSAFYPNHPEVSMSSLLEIKHSEMPVVFLKAFLSIHTLYIINHGL